MVLADSAQPLLGASWPILRSRFWVHLGAACREVNGSCLCVRDVGHGCGDSAACPVPSLLSPGGASLSCPGHRPAPVFPLLTALRRPCGPVVTAAVSPFLLVLSLPFPSLLSLAGEVTGRPQVSSVSLPIADALLFLGEYFWFEDISFSFQLTKFFLRLSVEVYEVSFQHLPRWLRLRPLH